MQQFDLLRRLGSTIPLFLEQRRGDVDPLPGARLTFGFASGSFAEMDQKDFDFIINLCLSTVERRTAEVPNPIWARVWTNGNLMFQDTDLTDLMELVDAVIQENLAPFFQKLRGASAQPPTAQTAAAS
jgi:hypothetical protein